MKTLISNYIAQIKSKGLSQAAIATKLGVSTATVSLMASEKYCSDRINIYANGLASLLDDLTKSEIDDVANKEEIKFTPRVQKRAFSLINQALKTHVLGLLVGQSGCGKSHVCTLTAKDSRVIKVKMRMNLSPKGIVDLVSTQLTGSTRSGGTLNQRFDSLTKNLRQSGIRLIIIDEADMFCGDTHGQFIKKIEIFRELYEAGFSVLLVGLNRLADKLKAIGEDYIVRRIKLSYLIRLTMEDISDYYDFLELPDCPEKVGIIERAYNNGNFGIVNNISEQYKIFGDIRLANELVFTTQSI